MKMTTLHLSDREMEVLEQLAETKELSKTGVMRQALRLYQLIDFRLSRGDRLFVEDDSEKREILVLIAPDSRDKKRGRQ